MAAPHEDAGSPPEPLPPPQPPPAVPEDRIHAEPVNIGSKGRSDSENGHVDQIIVLSGAEIVREANGVAGPGSDNAGVPVRTGSAMGPETIGTHELDVSPPRSAFGAQNWVSGSSDSSGINQQASSISPSSSSNIAKASGVNENSTPITPSSGRQWESTDSLPGTRLGKRRSEGVDNVVIGTPIRHDHANYVLMYDMLTGIRIAVSRCTAKPWRALEPEDFTAAHKLAFDITGDELTPSSKYDFKFKDYAPWVFRAIRDVSRLDPADYLVSLTGKYVLSELGSPGKSGSFFYFSADYRFIIKTIHHSEHKLLRRILAKYHEHLVLNPQTLINRIYGLHRVKLPRGRKIHFVVMANIFPPNKDIHETFDLKGSTYGRRLRAEELAKNPRAVQKDLNWLDSGKKVRLGPEKRARFLRQLEADVAFLQKEKLMDYSLLIGIHNLVRGNQDNIRDTTLAVFEPNTQAQNWRSNASEVRKAIATSDPVALGPSSSKLPEGFPEERRHLYFYQDDGGFRATAAYNEPLNEIYYLGVIDILTEYDVGKRFEHFFKSITQDSKAISAVNATSYGKRFLDFIRQSIA